MVPFVITQCLTNGTVKLQTGETQTTYNIRRIQPYKSETKVDDSSLKDLSDDVNI